MRTELRFAARCRTLRSVSSVVCVALGVMAAGAQVTAAESCIVPRRTWWETFEASRRAWYGRGWHLQSYQGEWRKVLAEQFDEPLKQAVGAEVMEDIYLFFGGQESFQYLVFRGHWAKTDGKRLVGLLTKEPDDALCRAIDEAMRDAEKDHLSWPGGSLRVWAALLAYHRLRESAPRFRGLAFRAYLAFWKETDGLDAECGLVTEDVTALNHLLGADHPICGTLDAELRQARKAAPAIAASFREGTVAAPGDAAVELTTKLSAARTRLLAAQQAAVTRFARQRNLSLLVISRFPIFSSHVYTDYIEGQRAGGGLYRCRPGEEAWETECLLEAGAIGGGPIGRMDLDFAAERVVFDARGEGQRYQVHVYDLGRRTRRQLTNGPHHNYAPCWLADGGIAFLSTRSDRNVLCFHTVAGTLHRMDASGGNIVRLGHGNINDFTPSQLLDGRVLYSRWEYVDKAAIPIQSLWTINPDGTVLRGVYGNRMLDPATLMEARDLGDGSGRILCTLTGHGGRVGGEIGLVDPLLGDDGVGPLRCLTDPNMTFRPDVSTDGPHGPWQTPMPFDADSFLASRDGVVYLHGIRRPWRLRILLTKDDGLGWYGATPLRPRARPALRPPMAKTGPADPNATPLATLVLQNVHRGLEDGCRRGEVKRVAVVEELIKHASNFDRNRFSNGFQVTAISAGATYAPKKVWGYARVEADGSAYFRVPANRPIYFLALDGQGRAVQRMRSFTHLAPGEVQGCIGCHEPRSQTSLAGPAPIQALRREAEDLAIPAWGVEPFGFREHVQPVLDRRCVSCHDGTKAKPSLVRVEPAASKKRGQFSPSYLALFGWEHPRWLEQHMLGGAGTKRLNAWVPTDNLQEWTIRQIAPKFWGSPNSRLADMMLAGHPDKDGKPRVKLSADEKAIILTWIDLNSPFYSGYTAEATKGVCASCQGSAR